MDAVDPNDLVLLEDLVDDAVIAAAEYKPSSSPTSGLPRRMGTHVSYRSRKLSSVGSDPSCRGSPPPERPHQQLPRADESPRL